MIDKIVSLMREEVSEKREEWESGIGGGMLRPDWRLSGPGANYHQIIVKKLSWHHHATIIKKLLWNHHETIIKLFSRNYLDTLLKLPPRNYYEAMMKLSSNFHQTIMTPSWNYYHETMMTPIKTWWILQVIMVSSSNWHQLHNFSKY